MSPWAEYRLFQPSISDCTLIRSQGSVNFQEKRMFVIEHFYSILIYTVSNNCKAKKGNLNFLSYIGGSAVQRCIGVHSFNFGLHSIARGGCPAIEGPAKGVNTSECDPFLLHNVVKRSSTDLRLSRASCDCKLCCVQINMHGQAIFSGAFFYSTCWFLHVVFLTGRDVHKALR